MAQADSHHTITTTPIDRRGALGALAAVAAAGALSVSPALASNGSADPIIGAIEAHRKAEAIHAAAVGAADNLPDLPNQEELEAAVDGAQQATVDASFALLETEPATIAGLIALLNYSVLFANSGNLWPNPRDYEWEGPAVHSLCAGFETALLARTVDLLRNKFAGV
jgi:hypothetical protein